MTTLQLLVAQAVSLQKQGRAEEAERLYAQITLVIPDHPHMLFNHGRVLRDLNRHDEALIRFDRALVLQPDLAVALISRGNSLRQLQRFEEALASFNRALAITPDDPGILLNRGLVLSDLGRFEEALASYDAALAIVPGHAGILNNRGQMLSQLGRHDEALAGFDAVLALHPGHAETLNNRGLALSAMKQFDAALAAFEAALAASPGDAAVRNNRGLALYGMGRFDDALVSFDAALALHPADAGLRNNHGLTLSQLGRLDEALKDFDAALAIDAGHVDALNNRGRQLLHLGRLVEARAAFEQVLALNPEDANAFGGVAELALRLCDWPRAAKIAAEIPAHIRAGKAGLSPFYLLGYSGDPQLQQQCAVQHVRAALPVLPRQLWDGSPNRNSKIRLAYLSADFHDHPTAQLMAELFERHDRSRFEVRAISFGENDSSPMRARLTKAFDRFEDVRGQSDQDIARHLHANKIDIAIDLKGHTQNERLGILAFRPAPVQVQYLGYPGTMGASFIDYVIADEIVAPFEHQSFFSEKIVHLPGCYQVNDSSRAIADQAPRRGQAGLPEQGFVFCCFNNSWKITAPVFDIWMRLLDAVPGSVLWLLDTGISNQLRSHAALRGIDPMRLVFAPRLAPDQHLARHRLADLSLDTLPYNAHTTASDALWAGLPLITCKGPSFAGRVGASLLTAIGLPELVTDTLEDYEALALKLARDPALLRSCRQKLAQNRQTKPLFDGTRFARLLEAAFTRMRDLAEQGAPPQSFAVAPDA